MVNQKRKRKFCLPRWDLNHGSLEPKASVQPSSYADPPMLWTLFLISLSLASSFKNLTRRDFFPCGLTDLWHIPCGHARPLLRWCMSSSSNSDIFFMFGLVCGRNGPAQDKVLVPLAGWQTCGCSIFFSQATTSLGCQSSVEIRFYMIGLCDKDLFCQLDLV